MGRKKILSSHILSLHVGDSRLKSGLINAILIITAKSMYNIFRFDVMKEIQHSHPKMFPCHHRMHVSSLNYIHAAFLGWDHRIWPFCGLQCQKIML